MLPPRAKDVSIKLKVFEDCRNWTKLIVTYTDIEENAERKELFILLAECAVRGAPKNEALKEILKFKKKYVWQIKGIFLVGACGTLKTSTLLGTTLVAKDVVIEDSTVELLQQRDHFFQTFKAVAPYPLDYANFSGIMNF